MNTDPLNIDKEPIPDDMVLIRGQFLQSIARPNDIPFRMAKTTGKRSSQLSAGILIFKTDLPRWEEAAKKAAERKEREKKYPSHQKDKVR